MQRAFSPSVTVVASAFGTLVKPVFVMTIPGGAMGPSSKLLITALMALGGAGGAGFNRIDTVVWPASESMEVTGRSIGTRFGYPGKDAPFYVHENFIENVGTTSQQFAPGESGWNWRQATDTQALHIDTDLDWNIAIRVGFNAPDATSFTVRSVFLQLVD